MVNNYTNYWAKGWLTAAIMPRYQVLSWRQPGRLIAADKAATRGEAAYTIYKIKWPVKKGGQLYIIQSEEPATLFNALDSMAAMNQILALVQDAEQGSDWRSNWWPQLGRWVPTTENGKQVIYEKPQTIIKHRMISFTYMRCIIFIYVHMFYMSYVLYVICSGVHIFIEHFCIRHKQARLILFYK